MKKTQALFITIFALFSCNKTYSVRICTGPKFTKNTDCCKINFPNSINKVVVDPKRNYLFCYDKEIMYFNPKDPKKYFNSCGEYCKPNDFNYSNCTEEDLEHIEFPFSKVAILSHEFFKKKGVYKIGWTKKIHPYKEKNFVAFFLNKNCRKKTIKTNYPLSLLTNKEFLLVPSAKVNQIECVNKAMSELVEFFKNSEHNHEPPSCDNINALFRKPSNFKICKEQSKEKTVLVSRKYNERRHFSDKWEKSRYEGSTYYCNRKSPLVVFAIETTTGENKIIRTFLLTEFLSRKDIITKNGNIKEQKVQSFMIDKKKPWVEKKVPTSTEIENKIKKIFLGSRKNYFEKKSKIQNTNSK